MKKTLFLFSLVLGLSVFSLEAQVKSNLRKIVSSDREEGDGFGTSVAVSGDYAIVGSMTKSIVVEQNVLQQAGAVSVFRRNQTGNWLEMQKLEPELVKANNYYGGSVSICGIYAAIGASGEDDSKEADQLIRMGAVYVFGMNEGKWFKVQKFELTKKEKQDNFGYSVSISDKYLVAGCPGRNYTNQNFTEPTGAVYVYALDVSSGNWKPMQEITAPATSGFWFGRTVSVSGNNIVVGTAATNSVFVYELDGSGKWQLRSTLKQSDAKDVGFGASLSICNNRIIVGAEGDKDAFEGIEKPNTDSVMEILNEEPNGKFSKLMIANNKQLRDSFGVKPEQFKALAKPVESIESRRKRMAGAGAAYVYKKDSEGNWKLEERLVTKGILSDDHFGAAVCLSDSMAVIAATGDKIIGKPIKDNFNSGAVYIFKINKEGKWVEAKKLTANKREVWAKFGLSLGVSQKRAIIGSRFESGDANEKFPKGGAGAAYICEMK